MNSKRSKMAVVLLTFFLGLVYGCQSGPLPRMDAYLGSASSTENSSSSGSARLPLEGIEAGLFVVNDSSAPKSAPILSPETFDHVAGLMRNRLSNELPIKIVKALSYNELAPQQDLSPFTQVAENEGLDYLVLAILSSEEAAFPTYLPFNGIVQQGGGTGNNPGYETRSFSRLEMALIDAKTHQVITQADGQAWATLYTLDSEVLSNVYPVVVRALQFNPIYPKSYANAHDILRSVSADDAIKQALQHFKEAWNLQRQGDKSVS